MEMDNYGKENLERELLRIRKQNSRSKFIQIMRKELNLSPDESVSNALRKKGLSNDFLKYELLI